MKVWKPSDLVLGDRDGSEVFVVTLTPLIVVA